MNFDLTPEQQARAARARAVADIASESAAAVDQNGAVSAGLLKSADEASLTNVFSDGAVNAALGLYLIDQARGWRMVVQRLGSVLLLVAPVLLIAAFFREAPRGLLEAPLAPFGLYAVFGGIVLHLISGAWLKRNMA